VNHSERTVVTVTKEWTDSTNLPVTMQLVRGGTDVADAKVVLSSKNNWTFTWDDLPLYVDGDKVTYTVREEWIGEEGASGSSHYTVNDDENDGYADYIVTTSVIETVDTDGTVKTNVLVKNTKDNGQVVFTKVNEKGNALPGAKFTVYNDEACKDADIVTYGEENTKAIFTADSNGVVTIVGLESGKYYVKETTPPIGYIATDNVYILTVKNNNSTFTLAGSKENVTRVTNLTATDITINKNWIDGNYTNNRPDSITVELKYKPKDAEDVDANWTTEEIELSASEEWTKILRNMPAYYDYKVTEKTVPAYYTALTPTITYDSADSKKITGITLTNQLNMTWQIIKCSSNSQDVTLAGAEFGLYVTNSDQPSSSTLENPKYTGTSDTNGVVWDGTTIADESYVLKETKAPAGYALNSETWNVVVTNGIPVITKSSGEEVKHKVEVDTKSNTVTAKFYFEDEVLYSLPSTGGRGIYWYLVSGTLLMMAAVLIIYKNKRREVLEN
jgi:LPXTG-motif cell wall-anchored protein